MKNMYFNNLLIYNLIFIFLSHMFLTQLKLVFLLKKNNNIFNKTMSLLEYLIIIY